MQVPEKLALIGGSILLSSTLVFTLKSQASSIIPHVSHSISNVFDHIGDAQKASDFDSNYQQAQKNGWTTGQWGTAPYYIDNNMNMHVGQGDLKGSVFAMLGQDKSNQLKTINIDKSVNIADTNSGGLLAQSSQVTEINGLGNVNITQSNTNIGGMFAGDSSLGKVDTNDLNVSNASDVGWMFRGCSLNQCRFKLLEYI